MATYTFPSAEEPKGQSGFAALFRKLIDKLPSRKFSFADQTPESSGFLSPLARNVQAQPQPKISTSTLNQNSESGLVLGDRTSNTPAPRLNPNVPANLAPLMRQSTQEHGVDSTIFSNQLARESMDYNPRVLTGDLKSPVGATGVAQFMPETAQWWAKSVGKFDPNNPEQAIPAAAQYMKYLLDQFNGDYESALAAYNWGEGNVRSHLRKYGSINRSKLPNETKGYLNNILGDK